MQQGKHSKLIQVSLHLFEIQLLLINLGGVSKYVQADKQLHPEITHYKLTGLHWIFGLMQHPNCSS